MAVLRMRSDNMAKNCPKCCQRMLAFLLAVACYTVLLLPSPCISHAHYTTLFHHWRGSKNIRIKHK